MIYEYIKFCPICGYSFRKEDFQEDIKLHKCQDCGFHFYHNMIPTSSVVIPKKSEPNTVVLTKRNMNPHKGKYDLPGGFFEYGERVEDGAKREIKEELGLDLKIENFIGVEINDYKYQQYNYKHTTIFFVTEPIDMLPEIADKQENSEAIFFDLKDLVAQKDIFAFEADYRILEKYKSTARI